MTNEERIRELIKNADKFDGLSFIKERIANREQLRKERKEKLKELMTNETKQTAVEWLFEQYKLVGMLTTAQLEKAKAMEKEQHLKTWLDSFEFWVLDVGIEFNDYYNETYGGNK